MANLFDAPPALAGEEAEQLQSMYRYLLQISEQLNEAMTSVNVAEFSPQAEAQIRKVSAESSRTEIMDAKNTLRSMIIKTAKIVRSEMEEISTELRGKYEAVSGYGKLIQDMSQEIYANAERIEQNFTYIEDVDGKAAGFEAYRQRMDGWIYSGQIMTDGDGKPILGIAIGEGVTTYVNGNPVLNDDQKMATFTKNKLSFWMGDTEVAYFSDKRMHIANAQIMNEMIMGRYIWKVQSNGSMGLMVMRDNP